MGSWFSNIHIRRKSHITEELAVEYIKKMINGYGYSSTETAEEADMVAVLCFDEGSPWISVYSNILAHDDPDSCSGKIIPISSELQTDVMGISCFDSDYLYLNLINAAEQVDAWVGIGQGKAVGISRRNNLSVWKKKVSDFACFSEKAKERYVIADEFLNEASSCIGLSFGQSTASVEALDHLPVGGKTVSLYFSRNAENLCDTQLAQVFKNSIPCLIGTENKVTFINIGEASRGLSIYFLGPYIEHEEITFSNVFFYHQMNDVPIELKKEQLPDGQWVYGYHNPDFPIPPKVSPRLKGQKHTHMVYDRFFGIRFTPNGNSRKALDVTVAFVPDANPKGRAEWNVWKPWGSKKAFIDHYNKIVKRVRAIDPDEKDPFPYLSEEEFD